MSFCMHLCGYKYISHITISHFTLTPYTNPLSLTFSSSSPRFLHFQQVLRSNLHLQHCSTWMLNNNMSTTTLNIWIQRIKHPFLLSNQLQLLALSQPPSIGNPTFLTVNLTSTSQHHLRSLRYYANHWWILKI